MKKENRKNINFYLIGGIGFIIIFTLNLFGKFVLAKDAAVFFSEQWWSSWFYSYIVWVVFLIIGVGVSFKKNVSTQH